ncbi:MAG: hypothetical protein PHU23_09695 [Dehalococcoidales bacterium]|nr:hypothetical protein [Dehalococcoidales bacterium]
MERVTRWSPDTCKCVFEYKWDDTTLPGERQHTLKTVVKRCEIHQEEDSPWDVVIEENQRKNRAFGTIQNLKPGLKARDYHWTFDKDRALVVEVTGREAALTAQEKGQLVSSFATQFGAGKVKFKE